MWSQIRLHAGNMVILHTEQDYIGPGPELEPLEDNIKSKTGLRYSIFF